MTNTAVFVGKADGKAVTLSLPYANRHGLIAGATGTGKTVTLQTLIEGFSNAGVPVFAADIKGDLSGAAMAGQPAPRLTERLQALGITAFNHAALPVIFWDVFGKEGLPLRATISMMGAPLLARLLELSEAQTGALSIAFQVADDTGMLLIDLKDLQALLEHLGNNPDTIPAQYGAVTKATLATIQRKLLTLSQQGGNVFFGEPALNIQDLMLTTPDGKGAVHLLAADKLFLSPQLYATFLLWLLSELFESLPEVGDLDKPKLVFFFDEAHLLFTDAPKALLTQVEQVVRLIRSKGVGIYFITQNPTDIPDTILGQLGNRVQHALRAFTERDQKAVKAAASTFRDNPAFDTMKAITELKVGEALVSCLEDGGVPGIVQRTLIAPPGSRIGAITAAERAAVQAHCPLNTVYNQIIDRVSAFEQLQQQTAAPAAPAEITHTSASTNPWGAMTRTARDYSADAPSTPQRSSRARQAAAPKSLGEQLINSAVKAATSSIGRQVGSALVRGLMGSLRR